MYLAVCVTWQVKACSSTCVNELVTNIGKLRWNWFVRLLEGQHIDIY